MLRTGLALLLLLAAPASAQQSDGHFRFGDDVFASGGAVTLDAEGVDDVFAAGERVGLAAPITGSAHLAARRVAAAAEIAGDLYAAGQDVTVSAPVAGDATLAGYDVELAAGAPVGGDLRAAGRHVRIAAPVAGSALLAGDTVSLDAAVAGDAAIDADALDFGPGARIDGRLQLYGAAAGLAVPDGVAAGDRVERHPAEDRPASSGPLPVGAPGWLALASGFVVGVLILAVLVFLAALVAPLGMERLGDRIADRPFRTLWIGFLTLSALIGASVLAVMSIIGILAAPAIMLATMLLCFIGYLAVVYLVGRAIWTRTGQLAPDTLPERFFAALIGALAVSLVALVPFLGRPLLLILTLTGLGALSVAWLRPEFRA
jgi:hypothetical protein